MIRGHTHTVGAWSRDPTPSTTRLKSPPHRSPPPLLTLPVFLSLSLSQPRVSSPRRRNAPVRLSTRDSLIIPDIYATLVINQGQAESCSREVDNPRNSRLSFSRERISSPPPLRLRDERTKGVQSGKIRGERSVPMMNKDMSIGWY